MVQVGKIRDDPSPNGIQMNIPHQFTQVSILLAQDRLVSILEKVAASVMPSVKMAGVAGKQPSHHCGQRNFTASQEKMCMILKKRPGIAACLRLRKKGRQTIEKIRAIFVVPEYLSAFDSPDHEVM